MIVDSPAATPAHSQESAAYVATALALEAGWMVTELGRQPWIIQNVMRTAQAVTPVPGAGLVILIVFVAIYVVLAVALIGLLLRLSRQTPRLRPPVSTVRADTVIPGRR